MASNVLPLFWQLSSTDKEARLNASQELVGALETFQQQHVARKGDASAQKATEDVDMDSDQEEDSDDDSDLDSDESGVEVDADDEEGKGRPKKTTEEQEEEREMAKLDRDFDKSNSEDVRYSVKRLIRGLASSRENSRFGFAVALTEVSAGLPSYQAELYS
jgi:DNA polymerase phi